MAAASNARPVAALFLATTLLLAQAQAQQPPPPPSTCPANLDLLSGDISLLDALAILGGLRDLSPAAAGDCLCIALGQITNQIRFLLALLGIDLPIGFQCSTPIPPTSLPGGI
ncbi:hypothetical protein SORBI_3001G180700 [Sorghum bicolor]|uniref:Hydrophobic seed protein domain-containing protein n=1 Tax=Sorghum bicolor TaxID=4558 RepID=A0A1B6QJK4_SORBI|nr:hypothetical protein SORBI_3001G180700 [Sorghum bicolor]